MAALEESKRSNEDSQASGRSGARRKAKETEKALTGIKKGAGAPRSSCSSIDSSFVQPPLSGLQLITERMERFRENDAYHFVGPFYEDEEPGEYKAPNLNKVDDYFFKPLANIQFAINDCVPAVLNSGLRMAMFKNRQEVHLLMVKKLKKSAAICMDKKIREGYSLKMFDNIIYDVDGNLIRFHHGRTFTPKDQVQPY